MLDAGAPPPPPDQDAPTTTHQVRFRLSGRSIDCDSATPVLTAAHEAGLSLPSSCGEGVCGTCKSTLLSGSVDMRHAGGIRQREVDEGKVLIEIPLTIGVVGAVLLPVWAAISAIAALVANLTISVEKLADTDKTAAGGTGNDIIMGGPAHDIIAGNEGDAPRVSTVSVVDSNWPAALLEIASQILGERPQEG